METRANYLLVGGFVLVLIIGLMGFVVWLAKFQFDTQYARYDIVFSGSVTGLSPGSAVRYSGVNVGEVIDIRLDRDRPELVMGTIEVIAGTPIREDTVATLELQGLTGGLYVLLSGGAPDSAPLEAKPGEDRPVIPSQASSLEQVISGAPELLDAATLLLARGNAVLNDDNRARVGEILTNVSRLTTTLAEQDKKIATLFDEAAETMRNLREASTAVAGLVGDVKTDSKEMFDQATDTLAAAEALANSLEGTTTTAQADFRKLASDLGGTAKSISGMADEIEAFVAENRGAVADFTSGGLYELSTFITEARDLLVGLNRVTTEVERDPARFLFGNQQQGYEANQ